MKSISASVYYKSDRGAFKKNVRLPSFEHNILYQTQRSIHRDDTPTMLRHLGTFNHVYNKASEKTFDQRRNNITKRATSNMTTWHRHGAAAHKRINP